MMRAISTLMISFLIVSAISGAALADDPSDGLVNEGRLSCQIRKVDASGLVNFEPANMLEARKHVATLTSRLKVALFRGDISSEQNSTDDMAYYASEIENFLLSCVGEVKAYQTRFACIDDKSSAERLASANLSQIGQVCDHECHLQLGRFHTYMSGDLLFMSSDFRKSPNADELGKRHARECGVPIVERGIELASRTYQESNDGTSTARFVNQNYQLQALKIRLLLNSGDIDYQNVSGIQVATLLSAVRKATSDSSRNFMSDAPTLLQTAYAAYDQARWALIELRSDVPSQDTDTNAKIGQLSRQITTRIESIENGRLFLNIDPEEFSQQPVQIIRQEIESLKGRLEDAQRVIENLRTTGMNEKAELNLTSEEEKRNISAYQINLIGEKIAQKQASLDRRRNELEENFARFEGEILKNRKDLLDINVEERNFEAAIQSWQGEIDVILRQTNVLSAANTDIKTEQAVTEQDIVNRQAMLENLQQEMDALQAQKEINRILFETKLSNARVNSELNQINGLTTKELASLAREDTAQTSSLYQWYISLEMTRMNLDLQFKSLGSQIRSHGSRFTNLALEALSKSEEYDSVQREYDIAANHLQNAESRMAQLYLKLYMDSIYRKSALKSKACEFERGLAFLGSPLSESERFKGQPFAKPGVSGTENYNFPMQPELEPNISHRAAHVLFEEGFVGGDEARQCFERRDSGDNLFGPRFAALIDEKNRFEDIFRKELDTTGGSPYFTASVDDSQFPFFANYQLPDQFNPEQIDLDGIISLAGKTMAIHAEALGNASLEQVASDLAKPCETSMPDLTTAQYIDRMCGPNGLREIYNDTKTAEYDFLEKCVYADEENTHPSCEGLKPQAAFARELYERHREAVDLQVSGLDKLLKMSVALKATLSELGGGNEIAIARAQAEVTAFVSSSSSMVSTIFLSSRGACGQGPCEFITQGENKSAAASLQVAELEASASAIADAGSNKLKVAELLGNLGLKVAEFENTVRQLREQLKIEALTRDQTLAEIKGQRIRMGNNLAQSQIQQQTTIVDCQNDRVNWQDKIANLKAQHQLTLVELTREHLTSVDTWLEIQQARNAAADAYIHMQKLAGRIRQLNVEMARLRNEAAQSLAQIENNTLQLCRAADAQKSVEENADIVKQKESLRSEIHQQIVDIVNRNRDQSMNDIVDINDLTIESLSKSQDSNVRIFEALSNKTPELSRLQAARAHNAALTIKIQRNIAEMDRLGAQTDEIKSHINAAKAKIVELGRASDELERQILKTQAAQNDEQAKFVETNQRIYQEIDASRAEVEKLIDNALNNVRGEGNKSQVVLANHSVMSEISMSVPDYVEVKKSIVHRLNLYLNKMRSRINTLNLAIGRSQIDSPGYIRSVQSINEAVDQVIDAIFNDDPRIMMTEAQIKIPKDSAFARDLFEKGKVRFQIAPPGDFRRDLSALDAAMRQRGYLTLWAPEFDLLNARLIGIAIASKVTCDSSAAYAGELRLRHLGIGTILGRDFTNTNEQVQSVPSKQRSAEGVYIYPGAQDNHAHEVAAWKKALIQQSGTTFEEFFNSNANPALRHGTTLLGLPVASSYELSVVNLNTSCNSDIGNQDLTLHFVISKTAS